jgi:flagellar assembly protein FliH
VVVVMSLSKSSKILSQDEANTAQTWQIPDVGGEAGSSSLLTAERLALIEEEARTEGFEQGRREGLAAGKKMIDERLTALDQLIRGMEQPLQTIDDLVEKDLVDLAFTIARQLIRREMNTQPDQIIAVVREALGVLPTGARGIHVFLNPADAKLVRELMVIADHEQSWKLVEDPALTRGGCRVQSEQSRVDSTVEARLNAVIANVLGDERVMADQESDDEPGRSD